MNNLVQNQLSPDELLLDPNNYRFQDIDGFVYAAESRFHESTVQNRAESRLRGDDSLVDLKNSILRNGYIPVERLVVRPYRHNGSDNLYVVIEGNRRLAAVKWILEDYEAGFSVASEVLESLNELPVVIAEQDASDEVFRASLMGIRHVSSIKQWGGYQRAKLIANMRDHLDLEASEVSERLGLSTHEVTRRYRAFKALEQMQKEEEYGGFAKPSMYPIFHEAVSLPVLRDWIDWNEAENKFENEDRLRSFYGLITPNEDDEGEQREPKITTRHQVRELRSILAKTEARRVLLDPHRSFQDALSIAKQDEFSRIWIANVSAAISSLETMGIQELKNLEPDELESLQKLNDLVSERLSDYESLTRD
jgi:hypothetical protein